MATSDFTFVQRLPTVQEYLELIASVGWKRRDPEAVRIALTNTYFAVCVERDGRAVGMGRVIGDGALHFYLSDIVVQPQHQRRGVGSKIVARLDAALDQLSYDNTHVGVFAVAGTREFYERLGYKAQSAAGPAMYRWLNPSADGAARRHQQS